MKRIAVALLFLACLVRAGPVFSADTPRILKLVYKAQGMLRYEKPHLVRSGKTAIGRSTPMAIYDAETNTISIIRVDVSLEREVKRNKKIEKVVDVLSVSPAGYRVIKSGGNGINTEFKITKNGKEYFFFGWHYIRQNGTETTVYSPYADFLARPEVVAAGREYLETKVLEARLELKKLGVHSRVIPDLLVADLIPERLLFNLALIEHMDEEEYEKRGGLYMGNKVLTQFALNRENTYSYAKSDVGALCLMQIMRSTYSGRRGRKGKFQPGILQFYPDARLPPNPVAGSCNDHRSAIVVAYLVLDDKLTYMPDDFKKRFLSEPLRFSFVLAAAYNGGHSRAIGLYRKVEEPRLKELLENLFSFFTARKYKFSEYRILREETWIFIKKYIDIDTIFHTK